MIIEVIKSKQRLTKSIVKQMPMGLLVLGGPYIVMGHVVNIIPKQYRTAIVQAGGEYFTIPLDFKLLSGTNSCARKINNKYVEYKFQDVNWWKEYESMRERALKTHIYIC